MRNLFEAIDRHRDRLCVIDDHGAARSYGDVLKRGATLSADIPQSRQLVVLEAANTLDWLALYIALVRGGHVVILTSEDGPTTARIAEQFAANWLGRRSDGSWTLLRQTQTAHDLHPDLAVLLSTSGSTGSPKLIRLSHGNLLSNAHAIAEYLAFEPDERAITTLPPYYSYGLSVIHSHLVAGQALILSNRSVSEPELWESVDRHAATSFAGVPHSFDLLTRCGFFERRHPSLRYITQAGGRLPPASVQAFARHAESQGQRFYVMYGQTEASPRMAYIPPEDVARFPDCIGVPIPGGSFRIDTAEAAATGSGELVYSGPNVMMGYAGTIGDLSLGGEHTELRTGDLAVINEAGYVRIVGRMSRFAKLFGLRIGFDDLETRLAAAGYDAKVTGDDAGLVVTTAQPGAAGPIGDIVVSTLKIPRDYVSVQAVEAIPLLASGKPDYQRMLKSRPARAEMTRADLRSQLADLLRVPKIRDTDTFIRLGGDSLNFVRASMILEEVLGEAPDGWERMPIAELERRLPARHAVTRVETSVLARAAAILLVVLHHVSEWQLNGAAYALLIAAGANFGRFSLPRLVEGRLTEVLASNVVKILLPYFAVISLIFVYVGDIHAPQFLLLSSFTDGFLVNGVRRLTIYWFVETYINILFVLCIVLSIGPVLSAVARDRWLAAWAVFALGVALRLCGHLWPDAPLFSPLGPVMLLHLFALGWLLFEAATIARGAIVAAVGATTVYLLPINDMPDALPLVVLMMIALAVGGRVPVGHWSARIVTTISAASLYIYILQPLILKPAKRLLVDGFMPLSYIAPLALAVLLLGIAAWYVSNAIDRYVASGLGLSRLSRLLSRRLARFAQR